jgi:ribosomal protein S19E (S16A)
VCRKLYDRQGMGIGLLRKLYGKSDKSRGARPERHAPAAGGLMRHMLIQLEGCGLVEKSGEEKGGRQLSPAVRVLPSSCFHACLSLLHGDRSGARLRCVWPQ